MRSCGRPARAAAAPPRRPPASPAMPPPIASRTLSVSACATICRGVAPRARRTAVCPRRATARASSRFATLAQAISSTRPQTDEQDLQAAPVLLLHLRDAGAGGDHVDHLLGKHPDDVRHPVGGIPGIVLHPLPQNSGEARSHSGDRSSRPQAADHAQPGGRRIGAAARLRRQSWVPGARGIQISGGSLRSVSPKNPGGATPITVNGWPSTMKVEPTTEGSLP